MLPRTNDHQPEVDRIRSVIGALALAGTISLDEVARSLGTSPRTLQRRLNQRGVSFWALVEQSRFEIAAALLKGTDLRVQKIAVGLGYSTPSGFARAFARWSGRSPSAYRRAFAVPSREMPNGAKWAEPGN
jgi:AraC-like DNA-binding protein